MTPGARLSTAMDLLDSILAGDPAGLVLTNWSRRSRYAGSKDRSAVRDIVFDILRNRRSLAFRAGVETGRGLVLAYAASRAKDGEDPFRYFSGTHFDADPPTAAEQATILANPTAPDPVRLNYPDFLDAEFRRSLGSDFEPVMRAMLDRAPVDLRVNLQRGSLQEAQRALAEDDIGAKPVAGVATALRVTRNPRRINNSAAFARGLVDLQDASSQAVALFANPRPGMNVLDYCAGGGGKALALYDAVGPTGHVTAHDIATVRMNDLPARAARSGARIRIVGPGHASLKEGGFDLVFADAPCSGTGSWRRTPDAKWRIRPKDLDRLDTVQADILEKSARLVRPGGCLCYATCSILKRENDDQVQRFLDKTPGFRADGAIHLTPLTSGDGFFAARLVRIG